MNWYALFVETGIKLLMENKFTLILKLNYLQENKFINIPLNIIGNIKNLCLILKKCFNLLTRFSYTDDISVLEKAKESFIIAEKLDIKVLTEVMDVLAVNMKSRLL